MSNVREIHTRGIVINRFSAGEGSVRVSILTEQLGLVICLAKSAREERSKLRAHLTIGTVGHFDLVEGQVWRVVGAVQTRNVYFSLHTKRSMQRSVARVLSLLRQLITGQERDEKLFVAAWNFFSHSEQVSDTLCPFAERFAVLQILAALGYVEEALLPDTSDFDYSHHALTELVPAEKQMMAAIKNGFVSSGLV